MFVESLPSIELETLGVWVALEVVWALGLMSVYSEVKRNSDAVRVSEGV
jgi:hypothetical protein